METAAWIFGLIGGFLLGIIAFSNIALPIFVGIPLSMKRAAEGSVQWSAAGFYLSTAFRWTLIAMGVGWGVIEFLPADGLGGEFQGGISLGLILGFLMAAALALFSPKSRQLIKEDIQHRHAKHMTQKTAEFFRNTLMTGYIGAHLSKRTNSTTQSSAVDNGQFDDQNIDPLILSAILVRASDSAQKEKVIQTAAALSRRWVDEDNRGKLYAMVKGTLYAMVMVDETYPHLAKMADLEYQSAEWISELAQAMTKMDDGLEELGKAQELVLETLKGLEKEEN